MASDSEPATMKAMPTGLKKARPPEPRMVFMGFSPKMWMKLMELGWWDGFHRDFLNSQNGDESHRIFTRNGDETDETTMQICFRWECFMGDHGWSWRFLLVWFRKVNPWLDFMMWLLVGPMVKPQLAGCSSGFGVPKGENHHTWQSTLWTPQLGDLWMFVPKKLDDGARA